jgi:hypothetical protein
LLEPPLPVPPSWHPVCSSSARAGIAAAASARAEPLPPLDVERLEARAAQVTPSRLGLRSQPVTPGVDYWPVAAGAPGGIVTGVDALAAR